jgi:hypothetical protein
VSVEGKNIKRAAAVDSLVPNDETDKKGTQWEAAGKNKGGQHTTGKGKGSM